jgi:hypothetical protein
MEKAGKNVRLTAASYSIGDDESKCDYTTPGKATWM